METCKELPLLTLNLKEDQNEVFKLLEVIKPSWKKEEVTLKVLSGGASACMLRCSHESGDSVTVRVRDGFEGMRNPVYEQQALKVLSSKGYFPPILAIFQNGFCYKYVSGRTMFVRDSKEVVATENNTRLIARQLANIHSTPKPEPDFDETSIFEFFMELYSNSKSWFEGCPAIDELKNEVRLIEEFVSAAHSPLVLSHIDPHMANMVLDEEKNEVTFVDWEHVRLAPRGWDVAFHLNSVNYCGEIFDYPVRKPDNHERVFCEFYLERWNEIQGKISPTAEEIEKLLKEFRYFTLVINLWWVTWFVKMESAERDFSSKQRFWELTYNRYLNSKEKLTGLRKLGPFSN